MKRKILGADLFCGAGGTSHGLLMAANEIGADLELIAINHWNVAIDTHALNHPYAKHLCTGLDNVDPRKLVPGGRLNVLCGSPECTHHSVARGGRPMSDQSRASAWHILRFAEALYIDNIVIENVREFQSWGPLGLNGRPMKSKKGQLFEQFIASLRALGYNVDWRVLNCADYGDPTTRERLFIMAQRGNRSVKWPEPTHIPLAKTANPGLFVETRKNWRTAREIIDWTTPSRSIFGRKKPLAPKTLLRIEAGLRKFCNIDVDLRRCMAEDLRPFLVVFRNNQDAVSIDGPVPTLTTSGANFGLIEPSLLPHRTFDNTVADSLSNPLRTVTAQSADFAVVESFIVPQFGERDGQTPRTHSLEEPSPAVTSHGAGALVQPFLTHFRGDHAAKSDGSQRSSSLCSPLPTQDTSNRFGMVEPFIIATNQTGGNGSYVRSSSRPLPTLVTKANQAVVESFVVTVNNGESGTMCRQAKSVNEPLGTVTGSMGEAVCEPFIVCYYGTNNMSAVDAPLPTAMTKPRFGLIEANVTHYMLDIRFRMLQPRELARAQGFSDSYQFSGNREQVVKQIGNAVPPGIAKALLSGMLA